MDKLVIEDCTIFDGASSSLPAGQNVLICGDKIKHISGEPICVTEAVRINASGKTLMPGLIDCHVHAAVVTTDYRANAEIPDSLVALNAASILRGMLDRGFTSVRDAGGADWGIASAIETGLITGPRLFVSGRGLSQTGGHGDMRGRAGEFGGCPNCRRLGETARVVNGVDAVRDAVRDELRRGAHQIKVFASGGVSSPTDPIGWTQFSVGELRAAVEEAEAAETYVMAHAYSARAVRRAVDCGVRTIEHGNLIDEATALLMAKNGVFAVPTLAVYEATHNRGASLGRSPESMAKTNEVRAGGLNSLHAFKSAGVKMGFGTDLSGQLHDLQNTEFEIRARVLPALDILRSATSIGAEILNMQGRLGCLTEGALADLIVVDGNPIDEISLLAGKGERLALIMKNGVLHKNTLPEARGVA